MTNLFQAAGLEKEAPRPLADRLRPKKLAEVVGQDHLVGPEGTLTRALRSGRLQSMILWGPPGTGKTTVARLLADETNLAFEQLSAIFSGVQDLRKAFDRAKGKRETGKGTLLFIDEIHRFNRSQQDSFLPYMEDGTITLVGATTENPSFELNGALLSRAIVLVFHRLDEVALEELLVRAETEEGRPLPLDAEARETLKAMADGDGRTMLNMAEELFGSLAAGTAPLDRDALTELVQRRAPLYDKSRDGHYNLISALHKAVRGSDPDAAALLAGAHARRRRGPPLRRPPPGAHGHRGHRAGRPAGGGAGAGGQGRVRLSGQPGGRAGAGADRGLSGHRAQIQRGLHRLRRGHARGQGARQPRAAQAHPQRADRMMKEEGYGAGYEYDHGTAEAFSGQNYFPDGMAREQFYAPPAAASRPRSRSGWSIGPSCAQSKPTRKAGLRWRCAAYGLVGADAFGRVA